jgi:hypothetical protein
LKRERAELRPAGTVGSSLLLLLISLPQAPLLSWTRQYRRDSARLSLFSNAYKSQLEKKKKKKGIEVEEEGRGGGERGQEKEEIPAIKSRCAEFGTLVCGSGM